MKLSELNPNEVEVVGQPKQLKLSELDSNDIEAVDPNEYQGRDFSMGESALSGFGKGVTLDFVDEITGGVTAGANALGFKGLNPGEEFGWEMPSVEGEAFNFQDNYKKARDMRREYDKKAAAANPYSHTAGNIAGSLATAAVPGLNISRGAGMGEIVGKSALAGGLTGAGVSEANDIYDIGRDALGGAAVGGALGYGMGKIGEKFFPNAAPEEAGLRLVGDETAEATTKEPGLIDRGLQKIGKIFADVPEDVTEAYLKNPNNYQSSKKLIELKDQLDNLVEQKRLGVQGLEEQIQVLKNGFDQELIGQQRALMEAADTARANISSAKDNFSEARSSLGEASRNLKYDLRNSGDPQKVYGTVSSAIKTLKDDVGRLSGEALETLKSDGNQPIFPSKWIKGAYNKGLKNLKIAGKAPITGDALSAYNNIKNAIVRIKALPEQIRLTDVKRIIQDLDSSIDYSSSLGSKSPVDVRALREIRKTIDGVLKRTVPEYAEKMVEVAKKTDLLSRADDKLGTPEKILSKFSGLSKEKSFLDRELLDELANETGIDIDGVVSPYVNAQKIAADPRLFDDAVSKLPQARAMQSAEATLNKLPEPMPSNMQRELAEQSANKKFGTKISNAEEAFQKAKDEFRELGLSERRSEAVIKSFMRGNPSINDQRAIQALSPDLLASLDQARVVGAFNKTSTSGARKVAAGAVGGFVLGGPMGAAIGAGAGATADKYAGRAFKMLLDGKMGAAQILSDPALTQKLGKFSGPLKQAAERGNKAVAATHYMLHQNYPEYRELADALTNSDDESVADQ